MDTAVAARRPGPAAALVTLVLVLGAAMAAQRVAVPPAPEPLLLTGARVLDTRADRYLAAAGVLIVGDRIDAIFAAIPASLPAGTRRIDLAGATLVPGLGDMFATASPDGSADADFYYAMALAHGVTSYRVVGARLPWAASERGRVAAGEIVAPRLWIGGPRLEQRGAMSFGTRRVADAAAAAREVAAQASLGAQWVSVAAETSAEVARAVVRASRAARVKVSAEPGAASAMDLVRLGVDAVDRVGFFGRSRDDIERELGARPDYPREDREAAIDYLWEHAGAAEARPVIPATLRRRFVLIPMLASFGGVLQAEALKEDASLPILPARWRDALLGRAHPAAWPGAARAARAAEVRGRLVNRIAASGVRIATGVDTGSGGYNVPGAGVHRELSMLVAAGLSAGDAIRAATVNCAEMLGSADSLGQIKVGFKADLIAVDGDPLARIEDLRRIRLVVRGGEVLERDQLLAQARRAVR